MNQADTRARATAVLTQSLAVGVPDAGLDVAMKWLRLTQRRPAHDRPCPHGPDCDPSEELVHDGYTHGPDGPTHLVCLAHPPESDPLPDTAPVPCRPDLGPGELCSVCWTDHTEGMPHS